MLRERAGLPERQVDFGSAAGLRSSVRVSATTPTISSGLSVLPANRRGAPSGLRPA
jgi:hypothetical protein